MEDLSEEECRIVKIDIFRDCKLMLCEYCLNLWTGFHASKQAMESRRNDRRYAKARKKEYNVQIRKKGCSELFDEK